MAATKRLHMPGTASLLSPTSFWTFFHRAFSHAISASFFAPERPDRKLATNDSTSSLPRWVPSSGIIL
jgi:hypothetical protein